MQSAIGDLNAAFRDLPEREERKRAVRDRARVRALPCSGASVYIQGRRRRNAKTDVDGSPADACAAGR